MQRQGVDTNVAGDDGSSSKHAGNSPGIAVTVTIGKAAE
jgi:hypothetical protein